LPGKAIVLDHSRL